MKVLVTCVPQAGHLNPMLPLISALVGAGDEVVVASGSAVREPVEKAGARFEPAGNGLDVWFGRLAGRIRGAPGDGLPPARIQPYFTPRLFAEIGADDMVDDVLDVAKRLGPELVLFEPSAFAGPLVARLVGARQAQQLWGALPTPEVSRLCADAVSPLWRSFGLDVTDDAGLYAGDTIAICPPSMEPLSLPAGRQLQLRPAPLPVRPAAPQDPPLVYFSLGTMWAAPAVVRAVLDALAELPVRVLATLGQLDPAEVGPVPANAQVHGFVPQADVLPEASAVIHHAGGGTMFGALAHGLPQLALPQAADNFVNADLLARTGAAIAIQPGDVEVSAIRNGVLTLLEDPSYPATARSLAAEIAAMPTAEEVADVLRAG